MKKVISLILSLLLCFFCVSCKKSSQSGPEMPKNSENFDQSFVTSFFDNYYPLDTNLQYISAAPWEVKLEDVEKSVSRMLEQGDFYLAMIDGVDKNHFVSATMYNFAYRPMGDGHMFNRLVYCNLNAPVPMRDWTISSVELICCDDSYSFYYHRQTYDEAKKLAQEPLKDFLQAREILVTYEGELSEPLFESLKKAFTEQSESYDRTSIEYRKRAEGGTFKRYTYELFIRFEECENIVWIASLESDENGLYFDCTTYDQPQEENDFINHRTARAARIDDQYAAEIMRLIEEHMKTL